MRWMAGFGVLCAVVANGFALSGTVKDNKGAAVAGAVVSLVSDTSARQTTNANGEFTLNKGSSGIGGNASVERGGGLSGLSVFGNQLRFSLAFSARVGEVSVYAHDGKKAAGIPMGPLQAGEHRLMLPRLAAGLYFLRVEADGNEIVTRLVHDGKAAYPASGVSGGGNALAPLRKSAAALDTLLVKKAGFASSKTPIASYDQTGLAITLNPDSGSISTLPPISDYTANGPFNTVVEANVGPGNAYTIFRPEPLGQNGFVHAPLIYGHGINGQVSGGTTFLRKVASHGFVIIGCNVLTGGPNSAVNNTAMTNGLDWLLQQNGVAGSKFQGKLAVNRATSMGWSVGGTAAVDIGPHPAIITVVSIHGHISKAVLHGTLLQTTGTKDNVGLPMQQQTFDNSKVQTFMGTVTGAPHEYITQDNDVERPAIIAWLRYWIYNDQGAKNYFYGNDCVMCKAPWENPQRKNWQ